MDELLKRFHEDPDNFRPDPAMVEKMSAELQESREQYDKELNEYDAWAAKQPKEPLCVHDVIEMGPDWWSRKVTPEKIKWNLDKGLSVEQIAAKLNRSVKTIEATLAKLGQVPKEIPCKEIPYGWKISKERYMPDETEQWVIKKIEDDRAANKKFDDIAKDFMKIGIKPRGGGLWFTRRLLKVQKENAQMWRDHRAGKLLLFEKGRMSPG